MERLQKFLANSGIASRRKCEELILEGKIKVNDKVVTELGTKIEPEKDVVKFNEQIVKQNEQKVYILLNKPIGYVTTNHDQFGRDSVLDLVKVKERVVPVGRLDMYTSGALILSNDGDFVYKVTHPKHEIDKTYTVTVIGKINNEDVVTFSIRIASYESRIKDDKNFMDKEALDILSDMLEKNESIIIAGPTGSGKTELQKYLLSSLPNYSRIILIDNIQELDFIRTNEELDVTSWQVTPQSKEGTFEELIRNALRSNPDWLVIAESRGKEMNDVLNSVMTGHPIISTIHAKDVESVPHRMVRLVEMSETSEDYDEIMEDILSHIKCYVYVNKRIKPNGEVTRFVESIAISNKDKKKLDVIYRRKEK